MTYPFDLLIAVSGQAFQNTLRDSGVVMLALIVSWGLRGRVHPALMGFVWILVIVRLLLPWSAEVNVPKVYSRTPVLPVAAAAPGAAMPVSAAAALPAPNAELGAGIRTARRTDWLLLGWTLGFLGVLCLRVVVQLRFGGRVKKAVTFDLGERASEVLALCRSMGLQKIPRFAESDAVGAPCVCGVLHPVILFPVGMISQLDVVAFRHITLHELAHIKRGDVLLQWIAALAGSVHWFNPLVWIAVSRQRADAELAADAKALRHMASEERAGYGETLLALAVRGNSLSIVNGPLVAGGGTGVKARVRAIAAGHVFGAGSVMASAIMLSIFAVAAFCEPVAKEAKQKVDVSAKLSRAGEKWRKTLMTPISAEFEDIAFKDVAEFWGKTFEVPLTYSPGAAQGMALHMPYINMRNATMGSLLDLVSRECGLVCMPAKNTLWIGAVGEMPNPSVGVLNEPILAQTFGDADAREKLLKKLEEKVSVEFEDISIDKIVQFLADNNGINFELDPRVVGGEALSKSRPGVADNGKIGYLNERNISIRELLPKLLPQHELKALENREVELMDIRDMPTNKTQIALIRTPLSVKWYQIGRSFEQYTLKSVDLATKTVVLNDDQLKKEISLTLDETKLPTNDIVVSKVSGLDFSVEEEYVWISSPELLRKESRWYGR